MSHDRKSHFPEHRRHFQSARKGKTMNRTSVSLLLLTILLLAPTVLSSQTTWTNGGLDGEWTNPSNWSGAAVPGTSDKVVINGPAAIVGVPTTTIGQLQIASGSVSLSCSTAVTLTIAGGDGTDFEVASGCSFTVGTTLKITTPGSFTNNGGITGIGNATIELTGSDVINIGSGTTTSIFVSIDGNREVASAGAAVGSNWEIQLGKTLTIASGVTFRKTGSLTIAGTITGAGTLQIEGVSGGSGQITMPVVFAGGGNCDLSYNLNIIGSVTVSAGTRVRDWGSNVALYVTGTLTNNGTIQDYEGSLTVTISGSAVNNGTWENASTTFIGTGNLSASESFNTAITLTSTAKITLTSNVVMYNSLTIDAGGELIVGLERSLDITGDMTVNGKLTGESASTSQVVLNDWHGIFAAPEAAPGATISSVKVVVYPGSWGAVRFSGICDLTAGASFHVDNYSTLKLANDFTVNGGVIQLDVGKLDTYSHTLKLDGVTFNVSADGLVDDDHGEGVGAVATYGNTSIDMQGDFYVPLHVYAGTTTAKSRYIEQGSPYLEKLKKAAASLQRADNKMAASKSKPRRTLTYGDYTQFAGGVTVDAEATLLVPAGATLSADGDLNVSGVLTGGDASSRLELYYNCDNLFFDNATISVAQIYADAGEGTIRVQGAGTFTGSTITLAGWTELRLDSEFTMIGGTLIVESDAELNLYYYNLKLDGTSLVVAAGGGVYKDDPPIAPPDGGAATKKSAVSSPRIITYGGASIEQGGDFDAMLQVEGATSAWCVTEGGGTASLLTKKGVSASQSVTTQKAKSPRRGVLKGAPPALPVFSGPITVKPEGTLTVGAGKTLMAYENVTVQERGVINGSGNLQFTGYATTFDNSGIVDVATTFENNGYSVKTMSGDGGSWKSLTIASECTTNVDGTHWFTGAGTPLVVDGTLNVAVSSNLGYSGTASQTVTPITYYSLLVDNAAGVTLPEPLTVNQSLEIISGNLSTGSHTLTLASYASIDETGGSVIGNLYTSRACTSGTKQSFGGLGLEFTPDSYMTVDVTRVTGTESAISGAKSIKRYFDLSTVASAYSGELVFRYKASELNGTAESALALYKSTNGGTSWNSQGGTVNTTTKSITLPGVTSLSRWTAGQIAPTLSAVSPTSGGVGTTLNVALTGTNYINGGTSVSFSGSGITVNSVTYNSVTQVTANITIASGATAGARDVSVTTGGGTATLTSGFSVTGAATPPPTLASISPTAGATGQTTNVTLNGSNFISGGTTVAFTGTGITVNSVTFNSATQVVANITIATSAATGARTVTVTTAGGSASLTNAFTVQNPSPVLTSLSPTTGALGQNINVFLTGTGFMGSSSTVSFGDGIIVADVSGSNTTLTVSIQISSTASVGVRSVSVTNPTPGGGGTSLSDAFTVEYPAPLITNVSPSSGIRGRSVSITVTGNGFYGGTTSLDFGTGIVLDSVSVVSPTEIRARATVSSSAAAGARNVSAVNAGPGGGTATLSSGFTVNNPAPGVTAVTPAVGARGKSVTVQITGTDFITGATTVSAGAGTTASAVTVTSPTQMSATFSIARSASLGARDIIVTNPAPGGGSATLSGGLTIQNPLPTLVSISPVTATLGQTLNIVVTGADFFAGTTTADFGTGITVNSLSVDTAGTQLTANVTVSMSAAVGPRSVSVANAAPGGGAAMLGAALTVGNPVPTITGVAPNSGAKGQTLNVSITGTNFIAGVTSADFGLGIVVNSVTITSPTSLTASITVDPNTVAAARSVSVVNAAPGGGKATLSFVFNVENSAPTIASVTPPQGARGENATVTVVGTGFSSGSTTVDFGSGITVSSTTVASPTQMTATLSIASGAALGNRNVIVTNPPPGGGTATLTNGFIVGNPLPTVIAVTPASGSRGQSLSVNLTGTGFFAGTTSVDFGPNIDVTSVNVVSPTQLSASITINTAAATGARNVQVTNAAPGGGTATLTNGFSVTNPAPTITSVAPTSLQRGGSANIVVAGTQFINGVTSVSFGTGVSVSGLVIRSLTELEVTVTVAADAAAGTRDVTVTNAAPGGGSASLSGAFTVMNPAPTLTALSPTTAGRGSLINVTVTGTQFISGVTTISFGPDITVSNTNVKSPTELLASISISPTASTGARAVSVTNPAPGGGTATLPTGFNVTTSPATALEGSLGLVPDEYVLHEAYPNPFNPSTRIRYGIPEDSRVEVVVHNMLGNVVAALVVGERSKGLYELQWHAENLPSGVYLVRLQAQSLESAKRFLASRKVVLVK